jgi:PAS domain S-box-containing protein
MPQYAFLLVLLALLLAGSRANASTETSLDELAMLVDEPASEHVSTEGHKVLIFGGDRDYYPFEWLDENGVPRGFNIELMRSLSEVLGTDIRIELGRWDLIRHGLEAERRIDISDMYYSDARATVVDFSESIIVVWEQIWIRKGEATITDIEDLRGRHVLVQRAGFTEQFLRNWDPALKLIPVDSEPMALRELASGRGDCALVTQVVGRIVDDEPSLSNLRPSGPPMLPRSYGLVVRKGDTELLQDINRAIDKLRVTGRLNALEDRWLVQPELPAPFVLFLDRHLSWILLMLASILAAGLVLTLVQSRKIKRQTSALESELIVRRQAEEALRHSQDQLRATFDNSPVVLALSRLDDGTYLDVNAAFESMTGYSRAEIVGRTSTASSIWENPADKDRVRQDLIAKGRIRNLELRIVTKSGSVLDTLFGADLSTFDGQACLLWNIVDISNRKASERALHDTEERWKFALDGSGEGVWDWDLPTNRVFASRRYKEILGYGDDAFEFDPIPWMNRVHPEEMVRIKQDFELYLKGHTPVFQSEVRLLCKDEGYRWVNIRGRSTSGHDNERVKRVIGTILDITDRKHSEEDRASLEEQLRQSQKMEVVGQLAGGVAHDFNNQLMVIRGYCDLLQSQGLDKRSQALLNEVIRASDRAAILTGRLLAFGRKQVRRLAVFNLNEVLSDMMGALTMMVGESISISIEAAPNLGNVRADRDQIEQVVANITVNARDAMAGGGKLTIRTRNIMLNEDYAAHHVGSKAGPHVVLSFQDTGIGMDQPTISRIFEPFFTTKQEGMGSGLGLSIVYGIVRQSGGHLTVESEPGRGAIFKVFLSRIEEAAVDEPPLPQTRIDRTRSATVLFVEDDPHLFSLLRGILESAGYQVLAASIPEQALELADAHEGPIDLLVTDVVMPGLSGPELAEQLQQKRPDIRILFISGYPKDVLERQTVLPQDISLLGKPFSPRDLLATVHKVLDSPPPTTRFLSLSTIQDQKVGTHKHPKK